MKACCTGCSASGVRSPSSVVTSRPATPAAGIAHERAPMPSTSTVHAPHSPRPQPYLGPLSCRSLRSTASSDASGGTPSLCALPLTCSVTATDREASAEDVGGLDALDALGAHALPG